MLDNRFALVSIRLLLFAVAAFYAILKLLGSDSMPLFSAGSDVAMTLQVPGVTNPLFATITSILMLIISTAGITLGIRSTISDFRNYKHLAPFSSLAEIGLLIGFTMGGVYYLVINLLVGTPFYYLLTVVSISIILSVYEWRQYNHGV